MNIEESTTKQFRINVNNLFTQQRFDVVNALQKLNNYIVEHSVCIDNIIEIGTAGCGFTNMLAYTFSRSINIHTFDINRSLNLDSLNQYSNIQYYVENVFDTNSIKDILTNSKHNNILFCDGGNKPLEFNTFAKFLKPGDFILCHDYVYDHKTFVNKFKDKLWNWHESSFNQIEDTVTNCNLQDILTEEFNLAVWSCFIKS